MKRASTLPSECTTIIVGDQMSNDSSHFLCRSSDFDAMMAINYEFHEDTTDGPSEFVAKDSEFRCPLWATQHCQIISSLVSGEVLVSIALAWE